MFGGFVLASHRRSKKYRHDPTTTLYFHRLVARQIMVNACFHKQDKHLLLNIICLATIMCIIHQLRVQSWYQTTWQWLKRGASSNKVGHKEKLELECAFTVT